MPRAANTPDAARNPTTAPIPRSDTSIDYPADAHGNPEVVLELVVGRSGDVHEATVVTGDEPFAEAARSAALRWQFEPAMRDGQPVAARIRFAVKFIEPAPPIEPAKPPEPPASELSQTTEPPKAHEPVEPLSVTVSGQRPDRSTSLSRAEVRELPGAFGDPFRAIEAMPGVTPVASGLPYFYVRGAPPGNVGYFFDGIRVPLLFHAAAGPSVIHPAFIDEVKLYSGAYPARFGRFAGGIVAADSSPPASELHGEANIRIVDAGGMLEVPFDGARGSVMLAGRYSYTAAIVSQIVPQVDLGYWDYQARASYDVTADDRVGIFAFGAFDFAAQEESGRKQTIYDTRFHRVDLRYDRRLSAAQHLRLAATIGDDRTNGQDDAFTVRDRLRGARLEYSNRLSDNVEIRAGADVASDRYSFDVDHDGPDMPVLSPHEDTSFGARADVVYRPEPWITLVPGVRADVYRTNGQTAVGPEPRISARFRVSDDVTLFDDFGLAHQLPSYVVPIPGFQPDLGNGLQLGLQSSAGVEAKVAEDVIGTLTLFQTGILNGADRLGIAQVRGIDPTLDPDARSVGHTIGAEMMVKKKLTRRLGGFVAYTLSRSQRYLGRSVGPASVDRTHVLNAAVAFDLGRGWRAGLRTVFYTGVPAKVAYSAAAHDPPRTLPFYRFDWRVEKRWPIARGEAFVSLVLEVLNTTLHKEVLRQSCAAFYCKEDAVGPVTVPSIGVEAAF
jgi:TonB family protein